MSLFRNALKFSAVAIGLGVFAASSAEAGPPSTRGYDLQHRSSGRYMGSSVYAPQSITSRPVVSSAPVYVRSYTYPSTPSVIVRSGPTIASPVTVPTAPAVTGDATAVPKDGPVIVWYEYVPSLGGWVEFRGTRVSGPPATTK